MYIVILWTLHAVATETTVGQLQITDTCTYVSALNAVTKQCPNIKTLCNPLPFEKLQRVYTGATAIGLSPGLDMTS